jgi:DNA anti-recombination protein RmuC
MNYIITNDELQQIVAEIAVKHHIAIQDNDPLLVEITVQNYLLSKFQKALEEHALTIDEQTDVYIEQLKSAITASQDALENARLTAEKDLIKNANSIINGATGHFSDIVKSEIQQIEIPKDKSLRWLLWCTLSFTVLNLMLTVFIISKIFL